MQTDPRLIVGTETSDDAGVMHIAEGLALVSTVDLITPVADDPYLYGQIAAANSLSDIYAMGARPVSALNVCCFPEAGPAREALAEVLAGGRERVIAAGALLLGGHTVRDPELKYGLAVNGLVHPERVVRNCTARAGDALVLTKPLGCGLLLTAEGKGLLEAGVFARALAMMARLNAAAGEEMSALGAHAATDVTGFGFASHLWEMLAPSGLAVHLELGALPLYDSAFEAAGHFGLSGPMRRNLARPGPYLGLGALPDPWQALLADPQTSGGLLIALPENRVAELLRRLADRGEQAWRVGTVLEAGTASRIRLPAA
jgi:selenide, water dikinase